MVKIVDMNLKQIEVFVENKNYWINKYEDQENKLENKINLIVKRLGNTDIVGLNDDIDEVFEIFEGEDPSEADIVEMLNYEFDNKYLNKFVIELIKTKIVLIKEQNILSYAQSIKDKKEQTEDPDNEVQG